MAHRKRIPAFAGMTGWLLPSHGSLFVRGRNILRRRPKARCYWPAQDALLVADLHLEKASWFARLGQFLPPYDSHATLTALAEAVERTGAARLYLPRRQLP